MRKNIGRLIGKSGLLLAAICLAVTFAMSGAASAAASADCLKNHTALKKKTDAQRAAAKRQNLAMAEVNAKIDSEMKASALGCVQAARKEAETFLAKPFKTRFSYDEKQFSDVCELAGEGATIRCPVVPAYWACVRTFKYSVNGCRKLDGVTAQPCCSKK